MKRIVVGYLLLTVAWLLSGCSTLAYYGQASAGHLAVLNAAKPVQSILDDPSVSEPLKERLRQARALRQFASEALGLPDNRSYTDYADLGRPYVVWNIFATPELSLELKTWCYPFFGCAGYRGYYDLASAKTFAARLKAQGFDVYVAGVPAYSTLGWMNWVAADPLLNTFIHWPDPELARLIFHELAHQVVYVPNDTAFNESFATAVEREGVRRWLAQQGSAQQRQDWADSLKRREDFLNLLLEYRQKLQAVYQAPLPESQKRLDKHRILATLKADYAHMRDTRWGGFNGYDRFFSVPLNGAQLASVFVYTQWVPAFEALLAKVDGDLPRFYEAVRMLGKRNPEQRVRALHNLADTRRPL